MSKSYNIPLIGAYNTRVSAVNASDSTSGYVGVGIVGLMIVGKTTQSTDKDTRYINCFLQKVVDPSTGKGRIAIVKRPGFGTGFTPWAGNPGYALLVWTGSATGVDLISAFGSTNSNIYNGNTLLGAITGRATGITETVVGANVATIAITSNDSTGWYYDTVTAVPTKITDADFLGNVAGEVLAGTFAHIDGFACYMTASGKLGASDLNSITAYTANSFGSTAAYPDKGVGCIRRGIFVMAFGTESVEFWHNAGLTPFPLARANAMTVKVGAVSADAIGRIADTIFWAGSTPEGGLSVFQYDGQLSRISSPAVDAILILAGASNISLTTIRHYGYSFVLVRAGPTTFAYCIEEKFWFEYNSTTPLWYKCVGISQGGTMVNYAISNVSTSGKVYAQNHAALTFEDDGMTYTARIQTANENQGTDNLKFYHDLNIEADTEISTSELTVAKSDDDFATYQTLGTVDLSGARPLKLTRLGAARQRAWALVHSANTPMRLHRAQGNMTVGNS